MATSKLQIEQECQQVQEQLLKLTVDREFLQGEFERLSLSSLHLLQQFQDESTSSQASDTNQNKYEIEKQKLEEKLKALELDILEKDKSIEDLDAKASDYLLQVSTFSNSLFDNGGINSNDCDIEGLCLPNDEQKEEVLEIPSSVDYGIKGWEDFPSGTSEEPSEMSVCNAELTDVMNDTSVSDPKEDLSLNVEVKTVINLVMEEIPPGETLSSENREMSVACLKAIQATNQVIENIQEQMEKSEKLYESVDTQASVQVEILKRSDSYANDTIMNRNENEIINVVEETRESDGGIEAYNLLETSCGNVGVPAHFVSDDFPVPLNKEINENNSVPAGITVGSSVEEIGIPTDGTCSPVREQMASLSVLVAELRRVKEDMGKCMTVKEQSFLDLEDQLQAANCEVNSLRDSMSLMSKSLEEKEQRYQALEEENVKKKMDIEVKMKEVQEVTNKCSMLSDEKTDILRKMEVLEIMMTEYRTEIEILIAEKTKMEEQTKELLSAKAAALAAEAEIDSRTNVEEKEKEIEELVEKIQSMERHMKDLNDKLKVTNKHLKVMAREREHKQKECEVLKRKVEIVELKMCELQGTFDMLVKAVMVERDELIKEMEEKNGQIDDMHISLAQIKETHEQELNKITREKRAADDELNKYKTGELKAITVVEKAEFDALLLEKERMTKELRQSSQEKEILESKIKSIQEDMNDFVTTLKDEMSRLKEETEKTKLEKVCVEETFASLQAEHLEITSKHKSMEKSFLEIEKSNKEKSATLEVLKLQLVDLQQQLEDLNTKNFNLSSELYSKEEEYREELSAREGTIQELNVTLTNNQKQSMENYNALQEDMTALQVKFKSSLDENKKQLKDMEDKLRQSQEEKRKEIVELQHKVQALMEELREAKSELVESQSTSYQECESSVSQDAELQSSSLAVVPSLPLDTVGESSSTSNSLQIEGECREVESKTQLIEALKKRGRELEDLLEANGKILEKKEAELQKVMVDIPLLNGKIKELTGELEEFRNLSSLSESYNTQAEFETAIAQKEEKIRELEVKVTDLEQCVVNKNGYILQLEGRLDENPDMQNNVEFHLEQIRKLSIDITALRSELEETHERCEALKSTVDELSKDKENFEQEKARIIEDYESKLQSADSNLQEVSADLEEKKKLG